MISPINDIIRKTENLINYYCLKTNLFLQALTINYQLIMATYNYFDLYLICIFEITFAFSNKYKLLFNMQSQKF
jgi:hypothetical protein